MRRTIPLAICVLLLTGLVLVGPSIRVSAASPLSNVQFHIGCSSFTASADTTQGFGFIAYVNPIFSSGTILPGTGHLTIQGNYGVTLPQGTIVSYLYGDIMTPIATGTVACSDGGPSGPPLPAGFVLRTITCTVAVFDAPGGSPVGDNKILAGQTWYINPTPVKAKDGTSWTELFDGGYTNGYIPTRCIGGAPAGS